MTLEEAIPLITASTSLVSRLVQQIMDSAHMTEEQRKAALDAAIIQLESAANKVKNARFEGPTGL